ncbi:MAG: helix-turn-helix domain-containing protein [Leptospiraceae bacterium]|nr:helix-turn-helix domain-containing protein [Leptospiraceae bacterium]
MMMLGSIIRRKRKKLGIKSVEIARRVGISRQAYSQIEQGRINPSATTLVKISKELNLEMRDFYKAISNKKRVIDYSKKSKDKN